MKKNQIYLLLGVTFILAILVLVLYGNRQRNIELGLETEGEMDSETNIQSTENGTAMELETELAQEAFGPMPKQATFYAQPLTDEVKLRITGISYPTEEHTNISYEDLSYVHVLYYDFNQEVKEGELICNTEIASDLTEIFEELYDNKYPIEKIDLIDAYNGDDEMSMEDNNTSCFNYRVVSGSEKLSKHAYGLAIDINPLYNPYVKCINGDQTTIQPVNAGEYVDRSKELPYLIKEGDICYQIFTKHGFTWGGDWSNPKDYQHFEK